MLHINNLTYRIEGRTLLNNATAGIAAGWRVGLVGRNGTGKSTLLRLIRSEIDPDDGAIGIQKGARLGSVAQEAPATDASLLDTVLAADSERAALLAEAETATDPHRIAEIQLRLTDIDAYAAPARAASILSGLGFSHDAQQKPCKEFSGGWRMRVALAALLFAQPDILLLDEPTNYLDLEGTVWLEAYLRTYPYTILIVSHDRDLLNNSVSHILHLENAKLTLYTGGYDQFERTRNEHLSQQLALKAKQDDERKHLQAFVDRFRAKASKARQAQSRLKMIEKLQPVATHIEHTAPAFVFPDPKPMPPPILRFADATLAYTEEAPVLKNVTLRIDQDDRIALLGPNGEGKSTLAKAMAGRLAPVAGNIYRHKKLKIGFFAQHQLEELNPKQSAYDHVRAKMPDATEAEVRAKTAAFGFGADKANTKCEKLSGGEKARLVFNLAAFDAPHMLILDEPTNHLDVDARESLVRALNEYNGAVILISHDARLIELCADRLWLIKDKAVTPFEGDVNDYRDLILSANKTKPSNTDKPAALAETKSDQRKRAAAQRQALSPLKKKAETAERELEQHHAALKKLDKALSEPNLFTQNIDRATKLSKQRADVLAQIDSTETAWLEAQDAYETARAELEEQA